MAQSVINALNVSNDLTFTACANNSNSIESANRCAQISAMTHSFDFGVSQQTKHSKAQRKLSVFQTFEQTEAMVNDLNLLALKQPYLSPAGISRNEIGNQYGLQNNTTTVSNNFYSPQHLVRRKQSKLDKYRFSPQSHHNDGTNFDTLSAN